MISKSRRRSQLEQRQMAREASAGKRAAGLTYRIAQHEGFAKRDAERLLAMIPDDTRTLTARLMGDPLPSRSALDRQE